MIADPQRQKSGSTGFGLGCTSATAPAAAWPAETFPISRLNAPVRSARCPHQGRNPFQRDGDYASSGMVSDTPAIRSGTDQQFVPLEYVYHLIWETRRYASKGRPSGLYCIFRCNRAATRGSSSIRGLQVRHLCRGATGSTFRPAERDPDLARSRPTARVL